MTERLFTALLAVSSLVVTSAYVETASARPSVPAIAFCGVHPDDPHAQAKANAIAQSAGVDATMGPCMTTKPPTGTWVSPAEEGNRYVDPDTMMRTLIINRNAGMKTVVYDRRLWDHDVNVRQAAVSFWSPYDILSNILYFDMGDEFDVGQFPILVDRISTYNQNVYPQYVTVGFPIGTFTNHLPWMIPQATSQLDANSVWFDQYDGDEGRGWVSGLREWNPSMHIGVAVNGYPHGPYAPTGPSIKALMHDLRDRGGDNMSFLCFCGPQIYIHGSLAPDPDFGTSIVNLDGTPTEMAAFVKEGQL